MSSNLPKILYDYQTFWQQKYGGVSRYFYELMKHGGGLFDSQIGGYFRRNEYIKEFNLPELPEEIKARVGENSNMKVELNKYDSITKSQNCDIFHPTYYDPYFLDKIKKPFVLTVYDFIHEIFPELNLIYHKETLAGKKILIERANRIIAISENTKRDLLKFYPFTPENKIEVIHLGTSYNKIYEKKPENKENYILYTGGRSTYKNFPNFFVAIFSLLLKYDLKLKCTGDPWSEKEIELLKAADCYDRCTSEFADEEKLQELYANALCFVFPSIYEGFGIPILEAWSCNCPIVLSNTSCFPEIAKDAGVYFDPNSVEDMRAQIEKVILSQSLREEIIAKGRERLKDFSWRKCAEKTAKVYESCLGEEPVMPQKHIKLNDIPDKILAFPKETFVMPELKDIFGKEHKFFEGYSIEMPDFHVYNLPNGYCIGNREEIWTGNKELVIDQTTQRINPMKYTPIPFEKAITLKGTVCHLTLGFDHPNNYGHWLADCCGKLALLKKTEVKPDYYIVSQEQPFQKIWLQILGIEKEKIIEANNNLYSAENLIFTELIWSANTYEITQYVDGYFTFKRLWMPKFIGEMYSEYRENTKPEKNIYISRANSYRRRVINESEITEVLQKYDYEIIYIDDISVTEQIKIFSQAKKIIGISGAGLANIFFAPANCKLLEIFPHGWYDPFFRVQAKMLGIDYNYIIGQEFGKGDPQKRDILLDKGEFEKALEVF